MRSGRDNLRTGRACLRPVILRPERANLRPERADLGLDLRPRGGSKL